MMNANDGHPPTADGQPIRKPWTPPVVEQLPKLTALTLQSMPFGGPITGGPGVF